MPVLTQVTVTIGTIMMLGVLAALAIPFSNAENVGDGPLAGYAQTELQPYLDCEVAPSEVVHRGDEDEINMYFFLALSECDKSVVMPLWNSGDVNVDLRDPISGTLLHIAARRDEPVLIQEFVTAGLNIEEKNRLGKTPLYIALEGGRVETTKALLAAGASKRTEAGVYKDSFAFCRNLRAGARDAGMKGYSACDPIDGIDSPRKSRTPASIRQKILEAP